MEYDHTIPMGLRHHSSLLSHHNAEGDYTIPMGLHHHTPLLLHHNAEGDYTTRWGYTTTALYYHIITWRRPYHSDGVRHAISGNYGME